MRNLEIAKKKKKKIGEKKKTLPVHLVKNGWQRIEPVRNKREKDHRKTLQYYLSQLIETNYDKNHHKLMFYSKIECNN